MKKSLTFILCTLIYFFHAYSADTVDLDNIKKLETGIFKYKDLYKDKYEKIADLKYKTNMYYIAGEKEKSLEYYNQLIELYDLYYKFSRKKEIFDETDRFMRIFKGIYEDSLNYNTETYYPEIFRRIQSEYKLADSLYQTGVETIKDFDWEKNIQKNRYKVIKELSFDVSEKYRVFIDNSAFIKKTSEMVEEVENKLEFMRNNFFYAVSPVEFKRLADRGKNIREYYNILLENLKKDIDFTKKDYYYSYIRKESEYILDSLNTIIDSTASEIVHSIHELNNFIKKELSANTELERFFKSKYNDISKLFQETMSKRPYSTKDLIIMQDELLNYREIINSYNAKINDLKKLKEDVENKYQKVLDYPNKFELVSYELLNDIAQYIIKAEKSFNGNDYELSLYSYKRADEFLERQVVLVDLYKFNKNVEKYVSEYQIDKVFPRKYKDIIEKMNHSTELSKRGKFEECTLTIKEIKSILYNMLKERKRHMSYINKYKDYQKADFFVYTIENGDSFSRISKRFFNTESMGMRIWAWNYITYPNPDSIHPGDVIKIYKVEGYNGKN